MAVDSPGVTDPVARVVPLGAVGRRRRGDVGAVGAKHLEPGLAVHESVP